MSQLIWSSTGYIAVSSKQMFPAECKMKMTSCHRNKIFYICLKLFYTFHFFHELIVDSYESIPKSGALNAKETWFGPVLRQTYLFNVCPDMYCCLILHDYVTQRMICFLLKRSSHSKTLTKSNENVAWIDLCITNEKTSYWPHLSSRGEKIWRW